MRAEWEMASRNLAVSQYAERSGMLPQLVFENKSIVPARLDRPCDFADCGGWHFLPKNCYSCADVARGYVPEEILEWM